MGIGDLLIFYCGVGKRRRDCGIMWHGLRNDIIMRNIIYGKWRKEIKQTGKYARVSAAPFLAPI